MAYWLMKSDPETWSWEDQVKAGTAEWDGVRNYQAANNMKAMRRGDRGGHNTWCTTKYIIGVWAIIPIRPTKAGASAWWTSKPRVRRKRR